jgi:hypothetical protein
MTDQQVPPAGTPVRECVPRFDSLAIRDIPVPDYADVVMVPLPAGAPDDPELWARAVFDPANAHGRRGRLYFAPVSMLHEPVTRSMLRSAARRLGAAAE